MTCTVSTALVWNSVNVNLPVVCAILAVGKTSVQSTVTAPNKPRARSTCSVIYAPGTSYTTADDAVALKDSTPYG